MKPYRRTKKSSLHRFYLISPKQNLDAGLLAERLLSLEPVEEVFLTDGDFGYIVKARFSKEGEYEDTVDHIAKKLGSKFSKAVSYYQYR